MKRKPRPAECSSVEESAVILDANRRDAIATLADHGIAPVYYDNGRPFYSTADVRRVAAGRPHIRSRPMY